MSRTSRKLLLGTIAALFLLAMPAVLVSLVGAGGICITSAARPADRYASELPSEDPLDPRSDADSDGVPDNDDILSAALDYVQTRPRYKSFYYASGYPDDGFGVCTDVVAIACRAAGYDLQLLVACDIELRPEAYGIEVPDAAIDFRRAGNLRVFLDGNARSLSTDPRDVAAWRGGDIVLYDGHIGIVSDRRDVEGVPYLIHHANPFQLRYEEDALERYGSIVGHYRLDPACLGLLD